MKLYAIGDIHGCFKEMEELLIQIRDDAGKEPAKIVFLGDYVDRGPDSYLVVEYLNNIRKIGLDDTELVFLKGNHEDMLIKAVIDAPTRDDEDMFYYNGGIKTMESYERRGEKFTKHEDFYRSLERYHRHGDFLFVHAGLNPGVSLEKAVSSFVFDYDPLLWAREWNKHDGEFPENVFVVHGHTPVLDVEFRPNQINIDTGCVFGKPYSEQYGQLTGVRLDGRTKDEIKVFQVRRQHAE